MNIGKRLKKIRALEAELTYAAPPPRAAALTRRLAKLKIGL